MASITTDQVRFNNTFLDESFEHACEIESQLPEYLPDIKQVVRVDARPLITEVKADNGILEAKGRVDIIVLYMPEEGSLQSHHCRIPFSTGLSGKTCPDNARYTGKVRMDSVTCRPLSGRKVELRCVVDMTLQGENAEVAEIVAPTANEIQQLECLNQERIVALCIDRVRDEFSVEEMIELPENSPRMERIVKCDVDAFIGDRRVTGGKAILSGELCVNCLYICDIDSGNMEQFATEIPFNRVVEVNGLQEGDEVGVQLNVMDTAFGILEDTSGEDRILSLKVGVAGQVSAYRNQQVNTVSDAYGKNLHCNIRHQDWAVEQVLGIDGCHVKISESFTPAEPIAGIYSAEAYADVKRVTLEDNKLRFQGDLLVSFLVRKENGDCAGLD
ncbi:MAG: DUF3794 domain-containing protein, partial [Clostridiales bacterium]|nr:DUF3794 domain-containing protein [Clostridiales bacterium]